MVDKRIFVHTNILSPYRRHLFALIKEHFRSATFLYYGECAEDRPWSQDTSDWGIESVALTQRLFGMGKFSISCYLVRALLKHHGAVHLVAMNGMVGDLLLVWLASALGWCSLILWNDGALDKCHSQRLQRLYAFVAKHGASGIFTPGESGRRYAHTLGFPDARIANSYFSHDVMAYRAYFQSHYDAGRCEVRLRLGIPMDARVILNVSRLIPLKRLVDLAESMEILECKQPDLAKRMHLVIVGNGADHDHEPLLEKLRLVQVHLVPEMPPDKLLPYYCAADMFVFPSEGDIWGLVVNEALSMGLPVVCCDAIGAAELIRDGVNGFVVPVRRPDMLMQRVGVIAQGEGMLRRFQNEARKVCERWNSSLGVCSLYSLVVKGE